MQTYEALKEAVKRVDGQDLSLPEWKMIHYIDQTFLAEKGRHMDANESLALVRSLTQFTNQVFQVKIDADFKFQRVLPVLATQVAAGARKIGWYTQEDLGAIDFLSNGAGDLKTLSMNRDEKLADIKIAGGRIVWSWVDIEAAIYQGIPLPTELGMTARRLVDRFHDQVTAVGNAAYAIKGLLSDQTDMTNQSDIGWAGLTDIETKVEALKGVVRKVSTATNAMFSAGMLVLPPTYYRELEDSLIGDNKDKTALDSLEATYRRRGLKIEEWQRFEDVTLENLSNKDVVMAFPFAMDAGENMIVDPFFMKPPKEDENYNVSAGVFTKTAGVIKRQPKAFVYAKLN